MSTKLSPTIPKPKPDPKVAMSIIIAVCNATSDPDIVEAAVYQGLKHMGDRRYAETVALSVRTALVATDSVENAVNVLGKSLAPIPAQVPRKRPKWLKPPASLDSPSGDLELKMDVDVTPQVSRTSRIHPLSRQSEPPYAPPPPVTYSDLPAAGPARPPNRRVRSRSLSAVYGPASPPKVPRPVYPMRHRVVDGVSDDERPVPPTPVFLRQQIAQSGRRPSASYGGMLTP